MKCSSSCGGVARRQNHRRGIDLNKARMRRVIEALLALSSSPNGFTASEVAARVRALSKQSHHSTVPATLLMI